MERKTTVKNIKYKILWGRVIVALVILIAVIVGIVMLLKAVIGGIAGLFSDDDSSKAKETAASVSSTLITQSSSQKPDSSSEPDNTPKVKVVIDAGHGGGDAGALDPTETRYEKDDVLKVALLVKQYLTEMGAEVVMTRDTDVFVTLDDRCTIANESQADLFVSIHRNLYEGEAKGVEIWVTNKRYEIDTALGQNIMDKLEAVGISKNRGVNFGFIGNPHVNYQVNRETDMPSCLIELGFMQDEEDNRLFDEHYDEYAKAIAEGVMKTAADFSLPNASPNQDTGTNQ